MSTTILAAGFGAGQPILAATFVQRTLIDYLVYFGAVLLTTAIVALWIASRRQPLQHSDRHQRHRSSSRSWFGRWFGKADGSGSSGKKRRRRRAHRKRNPTLAETGGLPPIRGEKSSSAEDSQP